MHVTDRGNAGAEVEELANSLVDQEGDDPPQPGAVDAGDGVDPRRHPDDLLLEDTDFEFRYEDAFDGLEDDPARQASMNVEVPHLRDWFAPFNDDRATHPYIETPPSIGPELHDLRRRPRGTDQTPNHLLDTALVDSAEPLSSLAPGSDVVALARQVGDRDVPDLWIADDTSPEASFAALVTTAGRVEGGSGWLTWEPHGGADTVRTDPVVHFAPHRHFPIGNDEPGPMSP